MPAEKIYFSKFMNMKRFSISLIYSHRNIRGRFVDTREFYHKDREIDGSIIIIKVEGEGEGEGLLSSLFTFNSLEIQIRCSETIMFFISFLYHVRILKNRFFDSTTHSTWFAITFICMSVSKMLISIDRFFSISRRPFEETSNPTGTACAAWIIVKELAIFLKTIHVILTRAKSENVIFSFFSFGRIVIKEYF